MKHVFFSVLFMLAASTFCRAQTFYFPQVAVGAYETGTWKTTIFVSNAMAGTASGTITFTRSDGTPLISTWLDEMGNPATSGQNTITFTLGPSQSRRFESIADIPLTTGYASVTSNSTLVLGNAVFSQFDLAGNRIGEAGVPMGIPLAKQAIFVDTTNGFTTGIAVANPNTNPLHIHFELVANNGQTISSQLRDLPPGQHMALFLNELFPDLPVMVGRLQFYCTNPMVSVGLRFQPSFVQFTTMAPIAIQP